MELNKDDHEFFENFLDSKFNLDELKKLVRSCLGIDLVKVVGVGPVTTVVSDLIQWTIRHGRTHELVLGVINKRPHIPEVQRQRLQELLKDGSISRGGPPLQLPVNNPSRGGEFSLSALHYTNRWLPWQKTPEEAALKLFLSNETLFSWWVLSGEGGVGKSRLAHQLITEKDEGWFRGTLSPLHPWWDETAPWQPSTHVLIVSDYASNRRSWVEVLNNIKKRLELGGSKKRVRLLFLIRPNGFTSFLRGSASPVQFELARQARHSSTAEPASAKQSDTLQEHRLITSGEALDLKVADTSLRDRLSTVLSAFARDEIALTSEPTPEEIKTRTSELEQACNLDNRDWDIVRRQTGGRWLLLQLYGYRLYRVARAQNERSAEKEEALLNREEGLESLLEEFLLRELRNNWFEHRPRAGFDSDEGLDMLIKALSVATLQRRMVRINFETLFERLTPKKRAVLWRCCQEIFGSEPGEPALSAVEPDLVGEVLVLRALSTLGWDQHAPNGGDFVPVSFHHTNSLVSRRVVQEIPADCLAGLGQFLGLVRLDFPGSPVTRKLFDAALDIIRRRPLEISDSLLGAVFDYGWGDDGSDTHSGDFAEVLLELLHERLELQQYLYDRQFLPAYQTFLENKACEDGVEDITRVLLNKLLGHIGYHSSSSTGPARFQEALEIANRIPPDDAVGRWYKVFLHDHISNALSKHEAFPDIEERDAFDGHVALATNALPECLRSGLTPPEANDLPVLIRAAHLWGHLGNQATRRLAALMRTGVSSAKTVDVVEEQEKATRSYLLAAVFRLAGYKISFFPNKTVDDTADTTFAQAMLVVEQLSDREGNWLSEFARRTDLETSVVERFMHRSQAIGDTAHQLVQGCKAHYQALALLGKINIEDARRGVAKAEEYRQAGERLWEEAQIAAEREGNSIIQYYLWTVEIKVLRAMINQMNDEKPLLSKPELDDQLNEGFETIRSSLKLYWEDTENKIRNSARLFHTFLEQA